MFYYYTTVARWTSNFNEESLSRIFSRGLVNLDYPYTTSVMSLSRVLRTIKERPYAPRFSHGSRSSRETSPSLH
ncbi:hypothetical protein LINPERPRIM_LOCUS23150 [Linum perenne]